MIRRCVLLLVLLAAAPLRAQDIELLPPEATPYRVGDTLVFTAKLTGVEQMSPIDPAPKLAQPLPDGIVLVRADSMRRIKNGHYESAVVFQFFRPGVQAVPAMVQRVRNLGADPGRVIAAVVPTVEIVATLPAGGEPTPEDIRDLEPVGPPAWPVLAGGVLLLGALGWFVRRQLAARRALHVPKAPPPPPPPALADARAEALARLDAIAAEGFARRGEVARHYEAVTDVLRDFLHAVRQTPRARGATEELLVALAAAAGIPASAAPLLVQADFVKFAAVRPDVESADRFLAAARAVAERWEAADAVR